MPHGSTFSRVLAEAFLSSCWTESELEGQGQLALGLKRPRKWFSRLVVAVISRFESSPPRRLLIEFLDGVYRYSSIAGHAAKLTDLSVLRLPRIQMRPAAGMSPEIAVPALVTLGDLSDWLELTGGELEWFAGQFAIRDLPENSPLRHYRYRFLQKSSGNLRLLEIPKPRLKKIQQHILHGILDQIPPHPAAHAFRRGRSIRTYVAPHAGQPVVLHMDLQDFFPSIRSSRIHALLRTVGYPERVARALTALCTHTTPDVAFAEINKTAQDRSGRQLFRRRHLPQGAPTSPALANLCARRLDIRLAALADQFSANYTRYADDLLFSGDATFQRGLQRFQSLTHTIVLDEEFTIHPHKTRILRQSQSQRVAGVVLNDHPNPARNDFDQLKATLFNCIRYGPSSQNRDQHPHFAQHLQGRIAYLTMINPQRGGKLKALYDQIEWTHSTTPESHGQIGGQPEVG